MNRRVFLSSASAGLLSGCAFWRIDTMSPFIRSASITSPEMEARVLAKASIGYTDDKRVRVLKVAGTPYEMGYQQGYLLRDEIEENIAYLYKRGASKFHSEEIFAEAYERMSPFIPARYLEEMHGLAHGSKQPLHVIHGVHALPEIGEWGGKKAVKKIIKRMMSGELGTSCSNFSASGTTTVDGHPYIVRILDWGLHRISHLHEYPVITVAKPDGGVPYANVGWAGFLGAISGMNAEGITLGEMGYGDPPHETLAGVPMPFLLREVLWDARSLDDARRILKNALGTNSFIFLIADGKRDTSEMYIKDRERFVIFKEGELARDGEVVLPPLQGFVYGGHFRDRMPQVLQDARGKITPEHLQKEVIPKLAMPSNFQNVIYKPNSLELWVANAADKKSRAAESPYTYFNLAQALASR
jgi:isopenicillin-N N-acyltransferase like protein